jgi:hypothetical protein
MHMPVVELDFRNCLLWCALTWLTAQLNRVNSATCQPVAGFAAWEHFLHEYKAAHPEVCIIDRLDRIRALHNRATMLTALKGEGITLSQVTPSCVVNASAQLAKHVDMPVVQE